VRRAPIVITATLVGLIGVLEFHTKPSAVGIGSIPAAGAAATASPAATTSPRGSAASAAPPRPGSTSRPAATKPAATRTAVGPAVNYSYGVLSVSVTVSGTKITKVGIASLDDGGNPRSQSIDQQSIPMLEQQTLQAQSANIQGVSGASYTSAGFHQSLQGALQKLGVG
jgi:uncharacterized protein with FMN-binding domain